MLADPGTGWEPAQVPGCSGEQARMQRGIAEHIGFVMGRRGKLQHGQTERPGDGSPSRSALAQVTALLFFLGATLAWG